MNSMMGIIRLDGSSAMLKELCEHRPAASLPIAGRYRVIDFALSNMVNAGITNVGILMTEKARSILDHLRSGKDWDLARHREGRYYMPNDSVDGRAPIGNLSGLYNNLDYVQHSSGDYVLVAKADSIYNMDFNKVLEYHQSTGADITFVYQTINGSIPGTSSVLKVADSGLVKDIYKSPNVEAGSDVTMGVYLMAKDTFINLVKTAFERGGTDLLIDGIMRRMDEYTIYAYRHEGYMARINSVEAYYRASMDIRKPEVWEELFMGENVIHTQRKDAVPVQYKETAVVTDSLIANGCEIRGEVENSILFRGVKVAEGAKVKNAILMQHAVIGKDAVIENVICDKDVVVGEGKSLKGADTYPIIVSKGATI